MLEAQTEAVDIVSAMNFSYWLLKDRKTLLKYFEAVQRSLTDEGIFFLDAYGGYDSHREIDEEREIDDDGDGFTYIWEQAAFDPITHRMECHIHFGFPDGSELRNAFNYEWRLWSVPEVRDLLLEAKRHGFSDSQIATAVASSPPANDSRYIASGNLMRQCLLPCPVAGRAGPVHPPSAPR